MRKPRKTKTIGLDLTKPIDIESIDMEYNDCFGKEWDMSSNECPICADRDICSIIFKSKVDKKTKEIKSRQKARFLDEVDFEALTDDSIIEFIESGKTTSKELIQFGMDKAKCDDVIAVKNKIKSFIKKYKDVSVKEGKVWIV